MLVLSDLKVEGYAMEDRFERLNIEQAKLTLSKVAKLHASGVIYAERVRIILFSSSLVTEYDRNIT